MKPNTIQRAAARRPGTVLLDRKGCHLETLLESCCEERSGGQASSLFHLARCCKVQATLQGVALFHFTRCCKVQAALQGGGWAGRVPRPTCYWSFWVEFQVLQQASSLEKACIIFKSFLKLGDMRLPLCTLGPNKFGDLWPSVLRLRSSE